MRECEFYPHTVRAEQQSVTHDTVKDHITQCAQKNCKNGINITELLDKEVMKDLSTLQPARKISTNSDQAQKTLEQDGFDIEQKVYIQEHLKRAQQLEEN